MPLSTFSYMNFCYCFQGCIKHQSAIYFFFLSLLSSVSLSALAAVQFFFHFPAPSLCRPTFASLPGLLPLHLVSLPSSLSLGFCWCNTAFLFSDSKTTAFPQQQTLLRQESCGLNNSFRSPQDKITHSPPTHKHTRPSTRR